MRLASMRKPLGKKKHVNCDAIGAFRGTRRARRTAICLALRRRRASAQAARWRHAADPPCEHAGGH